MSITVTIEQEDFDNYPWVDCDGGGVVYKTQLRVREHGHGARKRPWWRPLGNHHVYDVAATTTKAKRDAWRPSGAVPAGLTKGQLTALAVEQDYRYCLDWVNGDRYYVTIVVTDDDTGEFECLGGIEHVDHLPDSQHVVMVDDLTGELVARIEPQQPAKVDACTV